MKKFAISILNFFDNDNVVHVVEAETPEKAMIEVIKLTTTDSEEPYQVEYRKSLEEKSIDEIQTDLFNGDIAISKPVEII